MFSRLDSDAKSIKEMLNRLRIIRVVILLMFVVFPIRFDGNTIFVFMKVRFKTFGDDPKVNYKIVHSATVDKNLLKRKSQKNVKKAGCYSKALISSALLTELNSKLL